MSAFSKKVMYGIEAVKTLIKNIIDTYHNIDLSAHKKFNHHLQIVKPGQSSLYTDNSVLEPKVIFEIPDFNGTLNEVKVADQGNTTQVQYGCIKSVGKNGSNSLFAMDWNGVYDPSGYPYGGAIYSHRISIPGANFDQFMSSISIRVLDPSIETGTNRYPYTGDYNLYVPRFIIHGRGLNTSFDSNGYYREPQLIIQNDAFTYNSAKGNTAIGHLSFNDASGNEVAGFGIDKYLVVDGNNNVTAYRHQCGFVFRSHQGSTYTPIFFRVDTSTSSVDTLSTTIATNTFITGGLNVQNNATIQTGKEPSLYIRQTATAYTDVATNTQCGAIVFLDKNGNKTMAMHHNFKRTSSSYTSELYFTSLGYKLSNSNHELAIDVLRISVTTTGNTYPPTMHIETEASYTPSSNQDLATKKYVDNKVSGSDNITSSNLSGVNVSWADAGLLGRSVNVNGINYPAKTISSVSGTSYYRKHSDGFIEQWGWVKCNSLMAGGQGIKITFPTAYTNHSVVIITAMRTTVDVDSSKQYMSNEYTTVWSTSTTNFIVRHANQAQNNHYIAFYWHAMGK